MNTIKRRHFLKRCFAFAGLPFVAALPFLPRFTKGYRYTVQHQIPRSLFKDYSNSLHVWIDVEKFQSLNRLYMQQGWIWSFEVTHKKDAITYEWHFSDEASYIHYEKELASLGIFSRENFNKLNIYSQKQYLA